MYGTRRCLAGNEGNETPPVRGGIGGPENINADAVQVLHVVPIVREQETAGNRRQQTAAVEIVGRPQLSEDGSEVKMNIVLTLKVQCNCRH